MNYANNLLVPELQDALPLTYFCKHHANLWYAVWVCDNPDDVIQRQYRVTFELGVDVLALGAAGEQLDKVDVIGEGRRGVVALGL